MIPDNLDFLTSSLREYGLFFLYDIYAELGDYHKSEEYCKKLISVIEKSGIPPLYKCLYNLCACKIKVNNDEKDINLQTLYNCMDENIFMIFEGSMKSMMRKASHSGATYALILGETEQQNRTVMTKNMITGTEEAIAQVDLVKVLKK